MLTSFLLLWFVLAQIAPVERASAFEREPDSGEPLFTFERRVSISAGQTVVDAQFRDREGQIAGTKRVTYAGRAVVRYELVQHQVEERYVMTVAGDDAMFEVERNGKTSRIRRDWTPDTLTVDQIRSHVAASWDRLMRGEEISFRFVALSRSRIVRFTLKHETAPTRDDRPAVVLRMRAGNFFVRRLAPQIELVFTADGKTLLESRGPLPVKVRRGKTWVDLEARLVWNR